MESDHLCLRAVKNLRVLASLDLLLVGGLGVNLPSIWTKDRAFFKSFPSFEDAFPGVLGDGALLDLRCN